MDVADDGAVGLPLFIHCYSPVKFPLAYINQPEALLVRDDYHSLVTINNPVNRVTK